MNGFYVFKDLKVGMRINIEGRYTGDGQLQASQLEIKIDGDLDEMEGRIGSIDAATANLKLFGVQFDITPETRILDLGKETISLDGLEPGARIKVKGTMTAEHSYRPEKIKVKTENPDSMDELEGRIEAINAESRTLQVMGFQIHVGDDVEIEE
jgi:hypothetical protein